MDPIGLAGWERESARGLMAADGLEHPIGGIGGPAGQAPIGSIGVVQCDLRLAAMAMAQSAAPRDTGERLSGP